MNSHVSDTVQDAKQQLTGFIILPAEDDRRVGDLDLPNPLQQRQALARRTDGTALVCRRHGRGRQAAPVLVGDRAGVESAISSTGGVLTVRDHVPGSAGEGGIVDLLDVGALPTGTHCPGEISAAAGAATIAYVTAEVREAQRGGYRASSPAGTRSPRCTRPGSRSAGTRRWSRS